VIKFDRSKGRPEPIAALNRVREIENGEPLVRLADFAPSVKLPRATTIPWVRKSVAEMAERAARRLPSGVNLAVTDAFRPFTRQQMIWDLMWGFGHEAFPGLSYAQMRRRICRWVAPTDQKAPPGHCTGAAIDVILQDNAGEPIDVWSPYSRFTAAPTFCYGLSHEAAANRTMLVEALLAEGFSNCRDEWWHYSYGDAGWAVREGLTECFYGLVELDEAHYAESQREWIETLQGRPNPFLTGS
jgi:D-alanyl-D-alanine dipeptidase